MIYIGFLLLAVVLVGYLLRRRDRLYTQRAYLRLLIACSPLGFVAVIAGWVVTEVGRQPWVVQGLLRTVESATPLPASSVGSSAAMFLVIYIFLLGAFLRYLLRIVRRGPEERVPAERIAGAPLTAWYPPPQQERD
jgi:cytochrome d ubiquinol oxidase subunit I